MGSASDGLLYPGDKVISINHQDTSRMTHMDAQNLLRKAGTSAQLDLVRPGVSEVQQGIKYQRSGSLGSSGSGNFFNQILSHDIINDQNCPIILHVCIE